MATYVYPNENINTAGLATEVTLLTVENTLASIDGKITACDTGNVTVVSTVLPADAATQTTLAALDAKVTACNTGAVTISSSALPSGAATETTLAALDAKVTTCNTGAVTISSSALPAGAATETTLAALDTKVTTCNTGSVTIASSALPSGAATNASLAYLSMELVDGGVGSQSIDNTTGVTLVTPSSAKHKVRIAQNGGGNLDIYNGLAKIGSLEAGGTIEFYQTFAGGALILKNSVAATVATNICWNLYT